MLKKLKSFLNSNTDMPQHEEPATMAIDNPVNIEELTAEVITALKKVYDPEIPVNIYDLGLIYDVIVDDLLHVKIKMTLTAPGCPVAATFPKTVEDTVKENIPMIDSVDVELVWDPPWTMERMSDAAKLQLGMFG